MRDSFLQKAIASAKDRTSLLEEIAGNCSPKPGRPSLSSSIREWVYRVGGAVIAEYKRCSPSAGAISTLDPVSYVQATRDASAAYSVLTEPNWFCGSIELIPYFARYKPVLAKDFIVSETQIRIAACMGASAALLIMEALTPRELQELAAAASRYGVEVLVETPDASHAVEASRLAPGSIIGVNSRDLKTLRVDYEAMLREVSKAREQLPGEVILVAESGIDSPDKALKAFKAGAQAILVGTAFMKNPQLREKILAELLQIP
ncbi:indole-3-glycerol phosphate synthase [Aeropyrum pernix K1]|uniref:Indole-3-glycerol phosphate synthase n=1 Tax=Aeropyrum pernix (strain ATCC 700893 / DSM 11879 / JCM 9820 / NBRC 100138 / K1) TaxID=272557 RepID=TRPC_AERPE|nr:indole-3-glycerol-phosphate synthase [Aeropyrum pernix]Q9Y8T7.1 RecName: Full=Indole-3-glycerol phosphate synthase; Short=IGPS [Aeropyrum pernix K1]BAA81563.1 indole-3-glycerol phosphate synthase [Aeropyrum pernix K1]